MMFFGEGCTIALHREWVRRTVSLTEVAVSGSKARSKTLRFCVADLKLFLGWMRVGVGYR